MRKKPIQNRGQQTIDVLFEATAQLLDKASTEDFNTNRIADRAGFSIGTLYSYFPNKTSLMREMALREILRIETRFGEKIDSLQHKDPEQIIKTIIQLGLTPLKGRHRVRRRLFMMVGPDPTLLAAMDQAINRMTDAFLDSIGIDQKDFSRTRRFLLFRSVLGPIRAAALHSPDLLTLPEFEDDLVLICLTILGMSSKPPTVE